MVTHEVLAEAKERYEVSARQMQEAGAFPTRKHIVDPQGREGAVFEAVRHALDGAGLAHLPLGYDQEEKASCVDLLSEEAFVSFMTVFDLTLSRTRPDAPVGHAHEVALEVAQQLRRMR